ncbi:MAG: AMP-binding protein, partial [Halobaculum sp.]
MSEPFTPAPPADRWVGDWSARRARLSPDRVGLVDATTGRSFTYRELDRRANRVARLLRDHGVGHGDRVVTLSRNRPALVDLFFATGKLGAVLAPLSHRLAPPTLAEMLSDVDPTLLVVERGFADLAADVLGHDACSVSPTTLVVRDAENDGTNGDKTSGDDTADDDSPSDDDSVSDENPASGDDSASDDDT